MSVGQRARGAAAALGTVAGLPFAEALAFARAWWTLLACRLRLRFPRLLRGEALLRHEVGRGERPSMDAGAPVEAERLVEIFGLAVRHHVVAVPCLPRSVALRRVLRSHGIPSHLRIGMKRDAGRLVGHAWVESGGLVVGDHESFVRSYVPFRMPA